MRGYVNYGLEVICIVGFRHCKFYMVSRLRVLRVRGYSIYNEGL
jgi:hypothetical protein